MLLIVLVASALPYWRTGSLLPNVCQVQGHLGLVLNFWQDITTKYALMVYFIVF